MQPQKSKRVIFFGIASFILVFSSIFISHGTIIIHDSSDISDIQLGFPFRFISQDQSHYDPPVGYAWAEIFRSPWESATRIFWPQLLLNVLIVYGSLWLLRESVAWLHRQWKVRVLKAKTSQ